MSGKIKAINPEIIVKGCADKPYYQIKYYDKEDNLYHYGFGSYEYGTVLLWLREYFEPIQAEERPVNHGALQHTGTSWSHLWRCTNCNNIAYYPPIGNRKKRIIQPCGYKYCPNCGAAMESEPY